MPDHELTLRKPIQIHAEMAQAGILPHQLSPYWDPDRECTVDPLDDLEVRRELRRFLKRLWDACVREGTTNA